MARLIQIGFQPYNEVVADETVTWTPSESRRRVPNMPQIVWADGTPFREANMWALSRCAPRLVSRDTVSSNMAKLLTYANFLEDHQIDPWAFPQQRSEQCLIRYRGFLIERRERGDLSPSR